MIEFVWVMNIPARPWRLQTLFPPGWSGGTMMSCSVGSPALAGVRRYEPMAGANPLGPSGPTLTAYEVAPAGACISIVVLRDSQLAKVSAFVGTSVTFCAWSVPSVSMVIRICSFMDFSFEGCAASFRGSVWQAVG